MGNNSGFHSFNHALFDNMACFVDIVWEIDIDRAEVLIMKDNITKMLEGRALSLDEVLAHAVDSCYPEGRQMLIDTINPDFLRSLESNYEYITRTLISDRYHDMKCVITPMKNEYGIVDTAYMSLMDINNTVDEAAKKIKSKEELDSFFSSLPCGVIQYTRFSKKLLYVNDVALKIFGYNSIGHMQEDSFDGISKNVLIEDAQRIRELIHNIKSEDEVIGYEYNVRLGDGTEITCYEKTKMIYNKSEEPVIQRSTLDITNFRRINQQNADMISALTTAGMGTWRINYSDGDPKLYVDAVVAELIGCGRHINPVEAYKFWTKRISPEYLKNIKKLGDAIVEGKPGESIYVYNHPRFGTMTIRCGGVLDEKYDGEGTMILGYSQDISSYNKRLVQQIEISNAIKSHFIEIYEVDFTTETFRPLNADADNLNDNLPDNRMPIELLVNREFDIISDKLREKMGRFSDVNVLKDEISERKDYKIEIQTYSRGWVRVDFIASSYNESGELQKCILLVEDIEDLKNNQNK